jgi:predicted enzyme related to lactoylglutathione lyase
MQQFITGLMSFNVYVEDYKQAYDFYTTVLGLERSVEMGESSCLFRVGENKYGLYLEGGNTPNSISDKSSRTAFTFKVNDGPGFFSHLKQNGVRTIQDVAQEMGNGTTWFQFYDTAGNILEAISEPPPK